MEKFDYNILAYIGIFIVSINLIPQIFLIIKNKKAESISYETYFMNLVSTSLLIIYAYNLNLMPILIGNTMLFITSSIVIFLKYKYS
jgi:MtN3 and saliva related transmembrane protein